MVFSSPAAKETVYITFTRDMQANSGNVSYTGVGFSPSVIIFYSDTGSSFGCMGMGSETLDKCVSWRAGAANSVGTRCLYIESAAGAYQEATVNSMDADGFTLAWVKGGAPGVATATIMAVCVP